MEAIERFEYYETPGKLPLCLDHKTKEQLIVIVNDLRKEREILNRELKSKQVIIDIKSKQTESLHRIVKLFFDAAALANIAMEEKK